MIDGAFFHRGHPAVPCVRGRLFHSSASASFGRFSLSSFFFFPHSFIRYFPGSALSGRGPNERLCFGSHPSPSSFLLRRPPPAAGGPLNGGPCVTRIDCFHMRVRELPDQHKEEKHPRRCWSLRQRPTYSARPHDEFVIGAHCGSPHRRLL